MKAIILIILVIANIFTVYKFLFNAIFKNGDDFTKAVRYSLTPDIISLLRGKYWKDKVGEFKLGMFIFLCIAVTAVEYGIIVSILSLIIKP